MKKKPKRTYVTPVTDVVEVSAERLLCLSAPQTNSPFTGSEDWGSSSPDLNVPFSGSEDWGSSSPNFNLPFGSNMDW
jgi:hypothetical protein